MYIADPVVEDASNTDSVVPISYSMTSILAVTNEASNISPPTVQHKPALMQKPLIGNKPRVISRLQEAHGNNKPFKVLPQPVPTTRKPTVIRAVSRSISVHNESAENASNEVKEDQLMLESPITYDNSETLMAGYTPLLRSAHFHQSMVNISVGNKNNKKLNGAPPPLPMSNPVANSRLLCHSMMDIREAGLIVKENKESELKLALKVEKKPQPEVVTRKAGELKTLFYLFCDKI